MKFSDFVCGGAIRANLNADDKEGAIRELVGALVEANALHEGEKENIVKAIMKREELGSTGIGRGGECNRERREQKQRLFTGPEMAIFGLLVAAALVALWSLVTGAISF